MVKQLAIISGKGGTGKTTLTSSFVALAENAVIADCDVDAADMHLILHPEIFETHDFYGLKVATINKGLCTGCGKCAANCRFAAITKYMDIDVYKCEGCAVCEYVCPENAIGMVEKKAGEYYCSNTRFGPMVHAKLGAGEEASGKLVSNVKRRAHELASEKEKDMIIIDGPPGTGCAVIAAITGTDLVLIVTEPTVSGIHDLERVLLLVEHFRIPALVCINKYDINEEISRHIIDYCRGRCVGVAGSLPYDVTPLDAMVDGKAVVEYCENEFSSRLRSLWSEVISQMKGMP
ncbi:ATP-binding protein [Methanolobus sp. WCC5]|uniref:ATP-binding protein n=1 Tax=Methanolobus sp. WCC5 TaxID=3125785 RepID=UPI00324B92FD